MSQTPKTKDSQTKTVKSETRLTFGVEIEYLLATVPPVIPDPHPDDPREKDGKKLESIDETNVDISKTLKAAGVPVSILWEELRDGNTSDEDLLAKWILQYDISVLPINKKVHHNYQELGMEISSPPYYYDEASREAIRTVVKVLRNNYLVRSDPSTGLHVHVGNEHDGFMFPVLRNLVAILYTYERQIRLLLPADRVQTNQRRWCLPLSSSRFCGQYPELSRREVLDHILEHQNYDGLIVDMSSAIGVERLGFNLLNLRLPYADNRTIEFRLQQGMLDPDAILHWVHVCVKLVEKACLVKNQDEFVEQLRRDVEKPIGFGEGLQYD
ncbi:hypothetical protein SBOR_5690 [Sclerotinia borealis F-4128]|uniref:Amidoligase enzyme n=1 Tax=Sclerotinia borealis (strain F-4128) TaxID=1432307 RepID=W9CDJ1_SCLBF|nr:hypothetical protein SBOR_5690 [Sclerotinia borealis F-4128]